MKKSGFLRRGVASEAWQPTALVPTSVPHPISRSKSLLAPSVASPTEVAHRSSLESISHHADTAPASPQLIPLSKSQNPPSGSPLSGALITVGRSLEATQITESYEKIMTIADEIFDHLKNDLYSRAYLMSPWHRKCTGLRASQTPSATRVCQRNFFATLCRRSSSKHSRKCHAALDNHPSCCQFWGHPGVF
jgi:hypothetical protein